MCDDVKHIEQLLKKGGICEAASEARHILSTLLDVPMYSLYNITLNDAQKKAVDDIVTRRLLGEPLAYILNEKWFMGYRFYVDKRVLIPRYDTEILVERATQLINTHRLKSVLDMCTGSGCIAISLAKLTQAKVSALDISQDALCVAQENARLNEVQVEFFKSDMFENVCGQYDMIVCNPPYIAEQEYTQLGKDVKDYEPSLALQGGADGLDFYRTLQKEAHRHTRLLLLEIGYAQGEQLRRMFGAEIIKDLAGRDRVAQIQLTGDIYV